MVGGGKDAFIGAIHRLAANMDGLIELSCGALSDNPEVAKDFGNRIVSSWRRNLSYLRRHDQEWK